MVRTLALNCSNKGFAGCMNGTCQKPSPDIQTSYQRAQAVAREQKFGLWSDPFPVPPWDWRRAKKNAPGWRRMCFDKVAAVLILGKTRFPNVSKLRISFLSRPNPSV
jgi:hypothetical protein